MIRTAFFKAAAIWDHALIPALAEQPELAGATDRQGRTALHIVAGMSAEKCGREPEEALPLADALLRAGADRNAVHPIADSGETFSATPLWYAIARGRNAPL